LLTWSEISSEEVNDVDKKHSIRCLFGTDGVRDVANRGFMTPEMVLRLGRAYVLYLIEKKGNSKPTIVVGRDPRHSGKMLESALISGMVSAGANVITLGIIPTPGVSYMVKKLGASGGAVVSASHNPPEYNGVKFLDEEGCKLLDESEAEVEEYIGDSLNDDWRPTGASIGTIEEISDAWLEYAKWMVSLFESSAFEGRKLLVDCANGAAAEPAKAVFNSMGCEVDFLGISQDGLSINERSGVMHLRNLAEKVTEGGYDFGIAYDGDADRTLIVDSKGRTIDGDIMLWVLARWLKKSHALGAGVVATVMSNMALEEHLKREDISVYRSNVGDRYVMETMNKYGSLLGGEQSGHVIIKKFASTGDGLLTSLAFVNACFLLGEEISSLVDRFHRYPQLLRNVPSEKKEKIMEDPELWETIRQIEEEMKGIGRVLVRPSGTEPLVRVLVEAKDNSVLELYAKRVIDAILKSSAKA
jgi:phosphoglucosamine mutase